MPPSEPARVGRRALAHLLDVLLLSAVQLAVFFAIADRGPADGGPATGGTGGVEASATAEITLGDDRWFLEGGAAALYLLGVLALWSLVYVLLQGRTGQTPGKRLLGLRVVDEAGTPPGPGRSALRSLLWVVDAFPFFVPWLTGFLVARGDRERRQRIGDRVARTFVVRA